MTPIRRVIGFGLIIAGVIVLFVAIQNIQEGSCIEFRNYVALFSVLVFVGLGIGNSDKTIAPIIISLIVGFFVWWFADLYCRVP